MANAQKKRTFDVAFKLQVLDYASQDSNRAAVRIHCVNEKRVEECKKQREALEKHSAKKKRLDGAGQKAAIPDIEDVLILYIEQKTYMSLAVLPNEERLKLLKSKEIKSFQTAGVVAEVLQASPPISSTENHNQSETAALHRLHCDFVVSHQWNTNAKWTQSLLLWAADALCKMEVSLRSMHFAERKFRFAV